jgi:alpha-tubulin suppressor-like RCC1 family protein
MLGAGRLAAIATLTLLVVRCAPSEPSPPKLAFAIQPTLSIERVAMAPSVQVVAQDAAGATMSGFTGAITVALASGAINAKLSGTLSVAAHNGIATFFDLGVDRAAAALTLTASAGRTKATSAAFDVVPFSLVAVSAGGFPGSTGNAFSCGVSTTGAAFCWGSNANGQLGDGTLKDRAVPVAVAGGLRFATVTAGDYFACGVTAASAAYCWGSNTAGGLGNGTYTDSLTPVAVQGALDFTALSAGAGFVCGITTTGAGYCWGLDINGDLGLGTTAGPQQCDNPHFGPAPCSMIPAAVTGGLTFAVLSSGSGHSCGVSTNGAAFCWGYGVYRQIGNGAGGASFSPAPVSGGLSFASISTSGGGNPFGFSCGLTPAGAAWCWGSDSNGQLGNGLASNSAIPVAVAGGNTFASLSAGNGFACGITTTGAAVCWGTNARGQLGTGTSKDSAIPTPVGGGLSFKALSTGEGHTCGITTTGKTYCWGDDSYGELGNGVYAGSSGVPQAIVAP